MSTVHTDSSRMQQYLWATDYWTHWQSAQSNFWEKSPRCLAMQLKDSPLLSPSITWRQGASVESSHPFPEACLVLRFWHSCQAPCIPCEHQAPKIPRQQKDINEDFSDLLLSDYKLIVVFPTGAYWVAPPPASPLICPGDEEANPLH